MLSGATHAPDSSASSRGRLSVTPMSWLGRAPHPRAHTRNTRFRLSRSSHSDSSRFISAWRPPSDPTVPSRDSVPPLPGSHPNAAHQTARLFLRLFCAPAICPPSPAWFGSPSALLVEVLGVAAPCPATQGLPVLQRCLFPLPVWLMAPQRAGSVAGQAGFESSSPAL